MTCGIDLADFNKKLVKRNLENENRKYILEKGGFFGLTGPAVEAHWKTWHTILRTNSPFLIIEHDPGRFHKMKGSVRKIKRMSPKRSKQIVIKQGDLFRILRRMKPRSRVPLFRYGHLDYCATSKTLFRDHNLINDLFWLAKWKHLKSPFYLDVTFSIRGDGGMYKTAMDGLIPSIFSASRWRVSNPKRKRSHIFHRLYNEPRQTPMVNALYKFERI